MKPKKIFKGDLTITKSGTYDYEEVTGSLYIIADAQLPVLTTVGGSLYIIADAQLPVLTTVGGYLDIRADAKLDALTTIGGYLYISADAKLDAKKLKKKEVGTVATNICRSALTAAMALNGFVYEDGILSRLVSAKGGVSKVHIVGQSTISYIVRKDGHTAHGKTLAEARADLMVKLGNRDTTPYKSWTPKTEVSLEEMIVAYRTITGACGAGVSHFLSSKNYKGKLSVAFVISETKGAYGHEAFKGFFTK